MPESELGRKDDETRHQRRIGRTIAVASKKVTRLEFQRFLDDGSNRVVPRRDLDEKSLAGNLLQADGNWFDMTRYFNWLSKIEGIPEDQWCYEPNSDGKFEDGMRPAPDFLNRTGYRLPTEAEWEFACRAGAVTSRYYGGNVVLLPKYAWFVENSGNLIRPCGLLKPNDS